MIIEMVSNHSFTLTTRYSKWGRLRHLNNGVPQGSILAPLLFNIYISDLPTTISRKYAYTDDITIMHADGLWQAVVGGLIKHMATKSEYFQTWKLKFSTTKTVSAAFHLNNKETKCELKVNLKNETLPFCSEQIPWSNVGQVAHVSPTFARSWHHASFSWGGFLAPLGVLEQQLCKQPPLPWCIQPQSTALLSGAAVLTSALSFPPSTMPCELWLDACLLHQQTTFQSSQASNLQSFVATEPHCL